MAATSWRDVRGDRQEPYAAAGPLAASLRTLSVLPLAAAVLVRDRGATPHRGGRTMLHPMTLLELANQRTAEAERAAATRRMTRPAPRPAPGRSAEELRPLLEAAAALSPDEGPGWEAVRPAAIERTARLAADGHLPRHLVVRDSDPAVVVTRTLSAAWRHLTGTPAELAR
jgi:hypothetical protein